MASSSLRFGIARLFANVRSAAQLDRESIAAFRIAAGFVMVADALLRSRDFWLFFSQEGIFPPDILQKYLEPGCWSLNFLNEALWWQGAMLAAEAVADTYRPSHVLWHGSSGPVFSDVQNQQQMLATSGWLAFCTGACFYHSGRCCPLTAFSRRKQSTRPEASRQRRFSPKYLLCICMRASANYKAIGSMVLPLDMYCLFTITERG